MTTETRAQQFSTEISRVIEYFRMEYDLSYVEAIGTLRLIIDEIKRYLIAHPRFFHDSFRVRFVGFGDSSLDIEVKE